MVLMDLGQSKPGPQNKYCQHHGRNERLLSSPFSDSKNRYKLVALWRRYLLMYLECELNG